MYVDCVIYFVTSRTYNHQKLFQDDFACRLFLEVLDFCRHKLKFRLYAFVVMLDHIHLLILPNSRNTISDVMRHIKGRFANRYKQYLPTKDKFFGWQKGDNCLPAEDKFLCCRDGNKSTIIKNPVGEEFILAKGMPIWQKSFYDRIVRSDQELENTINYINYNAVKHQLVADPIDWLYSSFHNYCEMGKALIEIDYVHL